MRKLLFLIFTLIIIYGSFVIAQTRPSCETPTPFWSPRPTTTQGYVNAICGGGDACYQAWCNYFRPNPGNYQNLDEIPTSYYTQTYTQTSCAGTCKTNTCASYQSCSSTTGTCTTGNCCLGSCTTPTTETVNTEELKTVLINAIKDYFSSQIPKLTVNELKDLIVAYLQTSGSTTDLSGTGKYTGQKLIDVYNKAKGIKPKICSDGKCDAGENCNADASACADNKCYEPTCNNGCEQSAVANGQTDEACYGNVGCSGGNCKCDSSGNCIGGCIDSDGGLNYLVKGHADSTVQGIDGYSDCCKNEYSTYMGDPVKHIGPGGGPCLASGTYLYEAICNSSSVLPTATVYQCPNGCKEGVCISATCPDGTCSAGENCPADASACTDNKCYEPTCNNGCGQAAVANGATDEACYGSVSCTGVDCKCDGAGQCMCVNGACVVSGPNLKVESIIINETGNSDAAGKKEVEVRAMIKNEGNAASPTFDVAEYINGQYIGGGSGYASLAPGAYVDPIIVGGVWNYATGNYTTKFVVTPKGEDKITGDNSLEKSFEVVTTCTDTDGGLVFGVQGSVTAKGRRPGSLAIGGDSCYGKELTEFYCSLGTVASMYYNCPGQCVNGACA